jgi:superfamily II DNA helicase RecQ
LEKPCIPAAALTGGNVEEDPQLWQKVDRGNYRVVYATPEILFQQNGHFLSKTTKNPDCAFMKRLTLVAIDEAHTIWGWTFRKAFSHVDLIRTSLPDIPIAAFSATLPPHVMGYVQTACRMNRPTDVITTRGRRRNINMLVAEQPSRTSFQPMIDLLPKNDAELNAFPKTLIFVDSVYDACCMALELREEFEKHFPDGPASDTFIRTYYASIDDAKKKATIRLFRNGEALLTIVIDAFSLGVDISDIERVIQWGVTERFTLDTLVQRIGRAGRDIKVQAIAIIYAPRDLLDPVTVAHLKAQNPDSHVETLPQQDELDEDELDILDALPRYSERDLSVFTTPVEQETVQKLHTLKQEMYRAISEEKDSAREEELERKAPKKDASGKTMRKQPIDKI